MKAKKIKPGNCVHVVCNAFICGYFAICVYYVVACGSLDQVKKLIFIQREEGVSVSIYIYIF